MALSYDELRDETYIKAEIKGVINKEPKHTEHYTEVSLVVGEDKLKVKVNFDDEKVDISEYILEVDSIITVEGHLYKSSTLGHTLDCYAINIIEAPKK